MARNGKRYEIEASFRREKGNDTIQDTSFFNTKQEKQGKNLKNRGKNTKKQEKTGKKTGKTGEKTLKNRKIQEKTGTKQKITRNTETSFQQGSGKC